MTGYAFLLDLGRCIGCQACVAACKLGNELPEGAFNIHIGEKTQGVFPQVRSLVTNHRCFHCLEAACVTVCPTGALYKEDGLTRLDQSKCSGCGYCVDACPFDVPQIIDNHASKCDGCADVVNAGGQPWCVKTCPNGALAYDERDQILAEAHRRVEALKVRYPKAQVYGETEAGGLSTIAVLPDSPEALDLPLSPQVPATIKTWQKVVQPASLSLTGLSILVTGVAAIIARRNHMQEVIQLQQRNHQAEVKEIETEEASQPTARPKAEPTTSDKEA